MMAVCFISAAVPDAAAGCYVVQLMSTPVLHIAAMFLSKVNPLTRMKWETLEGTESKFTIGEIN